MSVPPDILKGLVVRMLLSNGDGTWEHKEAEIGWGPRVHDNPTLVGDFDNDGNSDLAFPFQDTRDPKGLTVRSLLSNGDGTWSMPEERVLWGPRVHDNPTVIGDFDDEFVVSRLA